MIERGRNWNYRNVEFADGQTTATLVLETVDDGDADEPDSEVTAKVRQFNSHPYGYLYHVYKRRSSATKTVTARGGTIRSSALSVADAEATEGEDDDTLDFTVRLEPEAAAALTVDYRTKDGTAEAGSAYTETSGTLTFAPGENEKTVSVPITDDDVEDDGETFTLVLSNALGAGLADNEAVGTIRNSETTPAAELTAEFRDMPETHDGERAFTFRVAFSEDIGISFKALRDESFTTTGGAVTGARRVDRRNDLWEITVEPDSGGDETITLPAGRECGVSGAICTKGENRRQLTNSPSATVAGPAGGSGPPELTAEFRDMPETHDGESAFTFRVAFSEDIGISFRALREDAFTVTGGRVTGGGRVDDRRDLFEMTVEPDSDGAVTITLPAGRECGVSGAICTKGENRRQLTNGPSVTVAGAAGGSGPPELTAEFRDMPETHDGESAFTFRVAFSEDIGISFKALRDESFTTTGGAVTRARRVDRRNDLWEITVEPDSGGDVTIKLPAGRECADVRCDLHQGREPAAVDQRPVGDGQGSGGELRAPLLRSGHWRGDDPDINGRGVVGGRRCER